MTEPVRKWKRDPRLGVPSERHEMQKLAEYLDLAVGRHGWLHVPNEGKRSARTGADLKRQGMKPGAPDVLVFRTEIDGISAAVLSAPIADALARAIEGALIRVGVPRELPPKGVAIELKREGARRGALKAAQIDWMTAMARNGWYWFAAAGADAAIAELKRIGFP